MSEGEAISRAAHEERDLHVPAGDGHCEGFVQYFPPMSPEAITYRSVTRLLRRSTGGHLS